ncbi:MAG: hypothetical protein HRU40_18370 [Saprospiraceae bacterium]|nr:hypothetical protein [Saprospiraceae bacterium]
MRALTVVWERIEVEPLTDNRYRISFHQGDARDEVVVKPLLSPTEYASLLAEYEKQLLVWESEIIQYDSTVASQLAILEDDHLDRLNTISQSYQKTLDSLSGGNMQGLATRTVYAFSIAQLGTWSCAIPFIPTEEVIVDQLKTVDGNPLTDQVAYLIDRKVNTIYRFYLGADGALLQFSTNPESDFVLILSETNATVFASSDMGLNEYLYQVPRRMKSVVLHDRHTITSVEEIRKILTI